MRSSRLGSLGNVSRLTLGGGGIGQGWGETSREEAGATLRMAADRGIPICLGVDEAIHHGQWSGFNHRLHRHRGSGP